MSENHYDVGIFGWWYNGNYGANLTYYALNRAVQGLGYTVQMLWRSSKDKTIHDSVPMRFAKKHYNMSEKYSKAELVNHNDNCDAFLLGSDQLWNPDLEKVAGEEFFLSFVCDEKVKLAYAQSLGNHISLKQQFRDKYSGLLKRFDDISVREDIAVDLFKNEFNMEVQQVCDPVFLVSPDEFSKLAEESDLKPPSKYVLNFILDPDKEKVDICRVIRNKLGIEDYINLTDLHLAEERAKKFEGEDVLAGTDIVNFIKAYREADYIITDSFHGTCMAIIFNKPFISIANKKRGTKRFESLVKWLKLDKRLFFEVRDLLSYDPAEDIDYVKVNKIIESGRKSGLKWLSTGIKKINNITSKLKKEKCIGCGACVSVCPKDALSLSQDEYGYYRATLNKEKCVLCKKCIPVCPALNLPKKTNSKDPECYAVQAADGDLVRQSTSGGIFSLLSEIVLNGDGKVYGAAWREDFSVHHISIVEKKELPKLRKSKYLQSYLGSVFRDIKTDLSNGTKVLFSGCPCQVAGLKKYLGKSYSNLITIDLLCGNSPSSLFFKKYLEDNFNNVLKYEFRHKGKDWAPSWRADTAYIKYDESKEEVRVGGKQDRYQSVYHNHTMCPPHCEGCQYQSLPRYGDLTIGDFWGIEKHEAFEGFKKGISVVLCNNKKGSELINKIEAKKMHIKKEVPLKWVGGNGFAVSGHNFASAKRDYFYSAIKGMNFNAAVDYAFSAVDKIDNAAKNNLKDNVGILQFMSNQLHFSFETDYWEEHFIKGFYVLMAKHVRSPLGHFATLPLNRPLKKAEQYTLYIKFKIKSESELINFHIKENNTKKHQIIYSYKLNNNGSMQDSGWIETSVTFVPNTDVYSEFMIGAVHLTGDDNYIYFDYINIAKQ